MSSCSHNFLKLNTRLSLLSFKCIYGNMFPVKTTETHISVLENLNEPLQLEDITFQTIYWYEC